MFNVPLKLVWLMWMCHWSFKDVSSKFWGSCKDFLVIKKNVPKVFQGIFKVVSTMCQECFKGFPRGLKGVSRKFWGSFKESLKVFPYVSGKLGISWVFERSFKIVSGKFQQSVKSLLKAHPGSFKQFFCHAVSGKLDISLAFQGSFMGVSRKFCFQIFFFVCSMYRNRGGGIGVKLVSSWFVCHL